MDPENPVFRKYDFGDVENLLRYGHIHAPVYDLSLLKGEIEIRGLVGECDQFGDLKDNKRLWDVLASYGVNYE